MLDSAKNRIHSDNADDNNRTFYVVGENRNKSGDYQNNYKQIRKLLCKYS